ncbi:TPA: hypothetical protein ACPUPU_005518 [Klebsiella pneumoniae]
MIKMVSVVPQPETVKMLRGKMGMTETALGAVMGYELRAWQRKEAISDDLRALLQIVGGDKLIIPFC